MHTFTLLYVKRDTQDAGPNEPRSDLEVTGSRDAMADSLDVRGWLMLEVLIPSGGWRAG